MTRCGKCGWSPEGTKHSVQEFSLKLGFGNNGYNVFLSNSLVQD